MSRKGLKVHVTHGWWEGFRRRHPEVALRTAAPLSYARAVASNPDIIDAYYDLLECIFVDNDLLDKPSQIFNLDETGISIPLHLGLLHGMAKNILLQLSLAISHRLPC